MQTTLDLPEALLNEAMTLTKCTSKNELIDRFLCAIPYIMCQTISKVIIRI